MANPDQHFTARDLRSSLSGRVRALGRRPSSILVMLSLVFAIVLLTVSTLAAPPRPPGTAVKPAAPLSGWMSDLGSYKGRSTVYASAVGPGPTPGTQRLYLTFGSEVSGVDVIVINTADNSFRRASIGSTQLAAWAIVAGADGTMYLATDSDSVPGHIWRIDPVTLGVTDLGSLGQERYIYGLMNGTLPSGRKVLYACTYPSGELWALDPATDQQIRIAEIAAGQQYAGRCYDGGDGYIYIGTGTTAPNVSTYNMLTGAINTIGLFPKQTAGGVFYIHPNDSGGVYAYTDRYWNLHDGQASPGSSVLDRKLRLANGDVITIAGNGDFSVCDPNAQNCAAHHYAYDGMPLDVMRLGLGPDGQLYESTVLPGELVRYDPHNGYPTDIGLLGGGEAYSLVADRGRLYVTMYSGYQGAEIEVYDPARAFAQGSGNPVLVTVPHEDPGWRAEAIASGGAHVYAAGAPSYGLIGGFITDLNAATNTATRSQLFSDQSVVSLAVDGATIVGGTSIYGGSGTSPPAPLPTPMIFKWDPGTGKLLWTVSVPHADRIDNVVVWGGNIYAVAAIAGVGEVEIVVSSATHQVIHSIPWGASTGIAVSNAAAVQRGTIWGLTGKGVYSVTSDGKFHFVHQAPRPVTAGFASDSCRVYFGSAAEVYAYLLPIRGC